MRPRDEMKEAKKEAGLCLHTTCGNKATAPPVMAYCEKHYSQHPHQLMGRKRKKRPLSG